MWSSIALHAAEGGRDGSASMLLGAESLLFADRAGTGTATDAVGDAADTADAVDSGNGDSANPRKRKKSSRACDFCHLNHQPCDNSKPRCSYCIKHGKRSCLYLRPQKKRGPAQGYRSALHTMRESAAAWGVATILIPDLAPLVAGYLEKAEGRRLVKAIKDPQQQERYIQAWQQSAVFKLFFSEEGDGAEGGGDSYDGGGSGGSGGSGRGDEPVSDADAVRDTRRRRTSRGAEAQESDAGDEYNRDSHDGAPHRRNSSVPAPPPPQPSASAAATAAAAAAAAASAATRPRPKAFPRLARPLPRLPPTRPQPSTAYGPSLSLFDYHNAGPYTETVAATTTTPTQSRDTPQHTGSGQNDSQNDSHNDSHNYNHQHRTNADHRAHSTIYTGNGSSGALDDAAGSLLADIMARDVAKSSNSLSNTLGLLGFAANETANDFQAMSYYHPADNGTADDDALLGSEMDQKAYYELLMGRSFR